MLRSFALVGLSAVAALSLASVASIAAAQTYTPIAELPGGAEMRRLQSALGGIGQGGEIADARWDMDAGVLWFSKDGWRTLDLETGEIRAADGAPPESAQASRAERGEGGRRPPRGRQFARTESPDGAFTAVSEGGNLFLEAKSGGRVAVTSDGGEDLKYGQASWVYGEELDQTTAMWWSPDSRYLAFYRFDESKVKDFHIVGGWSELSTRVLTEAYPKAGADNPVASLLVHEVATGETVEIDCLSEASGARADAEHYIYNIRWTPDGSGLLYSRTPRRQDVLEVLLADPKTGASRLVVSERQDTWQDNRPEMRFLADGTRFLWETEKTGFKHYELRSLDGLRLATVTAGEWPAE